VDGTKMEALDSGQVKCWGKNESGELGLGDSKNRGDTPESMGDNLPFVDLGQGAFALSLAAGLDQLCARFGGGTIKCWGGNATGQLGLGDTTARGTQPGQMGDNLPFVDLGHL
jgi:hypothetical protein